MSLAKIALLGTGYTLERVAEQLASADVVVTARSAERAQALRARGFEAEQLDISDARQIEDFFSRHTNLELLVDSVPPLRSEGVAASAGVRTIVTELKKNPGSLKKIIYLSTSGVYGVDDGSWVDETRAPLPLHQRGRERLEAEELYRSGAIPVCCFRIVAIYGPGRGIGISLREGRYPLIEDGTRWSNRIHVDDLTAALVTALQSSEMLPPAINLSDNRPVKTSDIVDYYCERFGFSRPQKMSLDEARQRSMDSLLSNQRINNELLRRVLLPRLSCPDFTVGAGSEF